VSGPAPDRHAGDAAEAEVRRARRELVKLHHPDHRGDAERFVEVLAALAARPTAPAAHHRTTGTTGPSWARRRRALLLGVRAALPRRMPGARRYATY
jgi:hypothetical protein